MSVPIAGLYGPNAILGSNGVPAPSTPVTVYLHGTTTAASLYTDQTGGTAATNPVNTDTLGNLSFYAAPGLYDLSFTVGGVASTLTVEVVPYYSGLVTASARVQPSGAQTLTFVNGTGTTTRISGLTASSGFPNPSGAWTINGGLDRIVCAVAGTYLVTGQVELSGGPLGTSLFLPRTGSVTTSPQAYNYEGSTPLGITISLTDVMNFAVGDTIGMSINPNNGATAGSCTTIVAGTFLAVTMVSA